MGPKEQGLFDARLERAHISLARLHHELNLAHDVSFFGDPAPQRLHTLRCNLTKLVLDLEETVTVIDNHLLLCLFGQLANIHAHNFKFSELLLLILHHSAKSLRV